MVYREPKNKSYRDKEWLKQQFLDQDRTIADIANECNVHRNTIMRWLNRFNIDGGRKKCAKKPENSLYKDKEWLTEKYWEENLSMYKMGEVAGCSAPVIQYWMKKLDVPTRPKLLNPDLSPSTDLSYIVGVLIGDGFIQTGRWKVSLTAEDEEFLDSFSRALSNIGLNPHRSLVQPGESSFNSKSHMRVTANSKKLVNWYQEQSFNSSHPLLEEYPKEFIRGAYESDGGVKKHPNGEFHSVWIYSTNPRLIALYQEVIEKNLGFTTSESIEKRNQRKDLIGLAVYGIGEVKRFLSCVNPVIKKGEPRV